MTHTYWLLLSKSMIGLETSNHQWCHDYIWLNTCFDVYYIYMYNNIYIYTPLHHVKQHVLIYVHTAANHHWWHVWQLYIYRWLIWRWYLPVISLSQEQLSSMKKAVEDLKARVDRVCGGGNMPHLPSGKHTKSYWKWPFSSLIYPLKTVIGHSYVSLPEDIAIWKLIIDDGWLVITVISIFMICGDYNIL